MHKILRPAAILAAACLVTTLLVPLAAAAPKPRPACNDGADNDGDGLIDAADPGCSSPSDTDEYNAPPPPPPPSNTCSGLATGPVQHPTGVRPEITIGQPPRVVPEFGTSCVAVGGGVTVCSSAGYDTDGNYDTCKRVYASPPHEAVCRFLDHNPTVHCPGLIWPR